MGRKKVINGPTAVMPIRMSQEDKQQLRELAAKDGGSMSDWVRNQVRKSYARRIGS